MEKITSKNTKTICFVFAKIGLTLIAFYIISKRVTLNPFIYFNENTINYFLMALFLSLILVFLQAWRWKNIVKIYSINLPYSTSLIAVWAGHFINNILPTATAGDLLRSYTIRYANKEKKWKWLSAFLFEKYNAATSALLIACLVLFSSVFNQLPLLLSLLIVGLFFTLILAPFIAIRILPSTLSTLYKLNALLAQTLAKKIGRYVFINSFFVNLTMCLMFYFIAMGLNAPLTWMDCLFVVPVFTILASLPISYAGWGVRELSCVELLLFFGVTPELAVTISVMYGLVLLFSSVPGVFVVYHFVASRHKLNLHVEDHPSKIIATEKI